MSIKSENGTIHNVIDDELDKLNEYDIPQEVIDTLKQHISEHVREHNRSIFKSFVEKLCYLFK